MEFKNIRSRTCLLFVFFCLSWFAVAQTNKNDNDRKRLLLGEWIWEEASIADDEWPIIFDFNNDYYKFYADIDVKENTVFLRDSDERAQEVKYEVDGNYLGIDLLTGESLIAEWVILEDKLYLEFSVSHPFNASKKVNLLVIYKRR